MKCKIQVETTSGGFWIYVAYIDNGIVIHRDLINKYETHPFKHSAISEVTKRIFEYKSLGFIVEIKKDRNINNMCNLDSLLNRLEF